MGFLSTCKRLRQREPPTHTPSNINQILISCTPSQTNCHQSYPRTDVIRSVGLAWTHTLVNEWRGKNETGMYWWQTLGVFWAASNQRVFPPEPQTAGMKIASKATDQYLKDSLPPTPITHYAERWLWDSCVCPFPVTQFLMPPRNSLQHSDGLKIPPTRPPFDAYCLSARWSRLHYHHD